LPVEIRATSRSCARRVLIGEVPERLRLERSSPREHLVREHAQRVQIGARADHIPGPLLGSVSRPNLQHAQYVGLIVKTQELHAVLYSDGEQKSVTSTQRSPLRPPFTEPSCALVSCRTVLAFRFSLFEVAFFIVIPPVWLMLERC